MYIRKQIYCQAIQLVCEVLDAQWSRVGSFILKGGVLLKSLAWHKTIKQITASVNMEVVLKSIDRLFGWLYLLF